jgi:tetratricopeptide (TPR) repeat protein
MRPMARASSWLLALAIAGSALAVGTVHTITLCVVTAVLVVAAVLAWSGAEPMTARPAATLILCTGVALTALTALQCLPLPIGWLSWLAPHNGEVWSRALAPLHEAGPGWAPVSLDPSATRVEVLKGVAYVLAFITALRVAKGRDGAGFLSATVVVTGMALAAAALLHPAFGAHKLYGLYEPGAFAERHVAPMMNPNNLAGYLNVAFCVALAAAIAPEPRVPRVVAGAVVLFLGATQIWVASRAGVLSMVLGGLVVLLFVRSARAHRPVATASLVVGIAAVAGGVLAVLGASQEASDELLQSDASKLVVSWHMMRMFPAMPWFGCGRGAFESAFSVFRADPGYASYAYPENFAEQWVLEWGLPVALAGIAVLAFALRPSAALARSTTAIGAWAALVALAVQNLADLGSNIPGLVLAGVVCAAIVTGGTHGRNPRWRVERWARSPTYVAVAAGFLAIASLALVAAALGTDLDSDRKNLRDAAIQEHVAAGRMHVLARAAMLRHPAEPYVPFITAYRASLARDDNPMPWVGATLERASVYGPAHFMLARMLAARSPSQARMEYRLALEQMPEASWYFLREVAWVVGGYDDAMELVPPGTTLAIAVLVTVGENVKDRLPATSVRLDEEVARREPTSVYPAVHAASDAIGDVEVGSIAPWCEESGWSACLRSAMAAATRAQQLTPGKCEGDILVARARVASGDGAKGLHDLEGQADEVADRIPCLQTLESIAHRVGDEERAQRALDKIANAGCSEDSVCATQLTWVAAREEERGNSRKALALYRRAYEKAPDDDALLEGLASLASKTGLHVEAAQDYERLARKRPNDLRWKTAAEAEWGTTVRRATNPP